MLLAIDQHACDLIQGSGYARLDHYNSTPAADDSIYIYVCMRVTMHVINTFTIYILFQPSLLNEKSNYIDNPRTHATADIVLGNNTRVGTANECHTGKKKKKVHIINGCIYIILLL